MILAAGAALLFALAAGTASAGGTGQVAPIDVTFLFTSDIHACRIGGSISQSCVKQGKTDANLLRHIAALNAVPAAAWPTAIGGRPTGFEKAGQPIGGPAGLVIAGDLTDDGGGQIAMPGEGTQLLQFSSRYRKGSGPDRVHFPVYVGLGNHDLDQDGPPPYVDWYRREMRDYVEINHRGGVFFKPPLPAGDYDVDSDDYAWDWGGLHLVQLQRFGGDTRKGAISGLDWLKRDLAAFAADGRPVILFQHYGWDPFSIEGWDKAAKTYDDRPGAVARWWSGAERQDLLDAIKGYNVIALLHGHEHATPMIYEAGGLTLAKPVAGFLGGFAVVRVTDSRIEIGLAEASDSRGGFTFTKALVKPIRVGAVEVSEEPPAAQP